MSTGVRGSTALSNALLFCLLSGTSAVYAQSSTDDAVGKTAEVSSLPTVKVTGNRDNSRVGSADGYVPITAATATKTDTPLIETPQSVSVVTSDQMTAQGAQTVAEALRYTASVLPEIRGASAAGASYLFSRGFYLEQYLDGARMPSDVSFGYAIPSFDPYGLERIDIVHGPASVLYGQAAPGGVANLVSKQPTATPIHEVFVTTGSHNRMQAGVDLGGPVTTDGKLTYRFTATGLDTRTQVEGTRQKRIYIAPAVTWKPDENTTLTVLAKYQRDPDVGYYNFVPAVGSVLFNPAGQISSHTNVGDPDFDHHSRTQLSVGYEFEHRFNPTWTFRQNTHYTYVKDDLANVFPYGYASGSNTTLNRYTFFNKESAKVFSIDNQAQAKVNTGPVSHTMLFGFDFQRVLYGEDVGAAFNASSLNVFDPVYGNNTMPAETSYDQIRQKQFGVYAQDQMAWGKWRFLIGAREDWVSADDNNPVTASYEAQSARAFTWRTGLVYLFDSGIAPYASFSKSFDPQVGQLYGGGMAKPTTAQQYEVGVKYQPPGYNSFITASLFNLTEHNVLTSDLDHSGYYTQAGEVRARGLELEGHASLTNNLDLVASYTYLNDVTTESNDTTTTISGDTTSLQNKRVWGIPRNIASAWLDYTLHAGPMRGLGFGGGVRYLGSSYDASNSIKVSSVTLFDATVHYDTGLHWLFSLNAKNLFNRQYVASCFSSATCTYGDGVEVLATARYRW
ncbi:TonB-dependent siderophore receptor [Paraburkholderia sp. SEWSISQ10-3 4]|uniref:TonB-dependent siderophore receptor n=1 Tax=Paraburkholderia TaxID=1822464 RepID=UPI002250DB33|nr:MULTISPECIES: TonB-dependent siderophore receptor [Paraburkholderia]MCX4137950.1 TonB-dependent siderophore receptor [Paraburkholderia aspalathi]MDN7170641.1 TonB-dependent siderophore receptor [Paraburkholderia sp. SEWSISQ10-3 4]MDQ6500280.1 TonB-dependent siderophore receptor [Paraburkholderia aspalathi]